MPAGAFIGLVVDAWVLYRAFGSRLLPADAAWPPGTAAAETIKAGHRGGRRALILAGATAVGLAGTLISLPLSAAGVAFLGNVWALMMFGIGLMPRQYGRTRSTPTWEPGTSRTASWSAPGSWHSARPCVCCSAVASANEPRSRRRPGDQPARQAGREAR